MSWVPVVKLASWPQVSCFVFLVINLRQYWPIMVRSTFLRASANKNNEMNHQLILGRNEIQSRVTLCTHTATSSLQMYFSRIRSLRSQTYLCSNYKSHYEDQLFTNSVFTLYCIVFVLYLYCICTVFVQYLYL